MQETPIGQVSDDVAIGWKDEKDTVGRLLDRRKEEYGNTWLDVGLIVQALNPLFVKFVTDAPDLVHNWILIASKLLRILHSPYNPDHWTDMEGYSRLVREYIEDRINENRN